MKNVLCLLVYIFSIIMLQSACVSLKIPRRNDLVPLQAPMLIGKYPAIIERKLTLYSGKDTLLPTIIWYHFKNSPGKDSAELAQATHMELILKDAKHISSTLYKDDVALKTDVIRGRLKKGYFRKKHQLSLSGIPPFYWSISSNKMQLGLGKEHQLFIDHADETNGSILIIVAGTPGITSSLSVPRYVK
ncbi:hypothetical protein LPB86_14515 [Pedobacter sp. MC2016-14]|uniref:hypothetical protein n=1 Tax=Pedobacter sp. MC2016-14 TaxID=2897327 RepID=UPI001E624C06|nr:hypothetical protein [Pedobacter sp. MC2016-14]MCD0489453.1 hypothetical protein [Pedobacter sp. MC2016-14]